MGRRNKRGCSFCTKEYDYYETDRKKHLEEVGGDDGLLERIESTLREFARRLIRSDG